MGARQPVDVGVSRLGFYARVSSEEQRQGYSIVAQLRAGRALAAERGMEFTPYVEPGRSAKGEDLRRRPVFRQMMEDAEAGRLTMVAVHKLDRFSRNLRVTLEQFERFARPGVTFVSLTENLDFSSPWGRLALAMLGALAQFYSENLGQETSKGKQERKAQGLPNGLLPFGAIAGPGGVPIPDRTPFCVITWGERDGKPVVLGGRETCNYAGLILAFETAAKGRSDADVARTLNQAGYRTTGNRGRNLFTKDTVAEILTNRFYLGELPFYEKTAVNGRSRKRQTGWVPGRHDPFLPEDLFGEVQEARERNRLTPRTIRAAAQPWSLSGIALCHECRSKLHAQQTIRGRRRVICYGRSQGKDCHHPSAFLDIYEEQVCDVLGAIHLPDDFQACILALYERERRKNSQTSHDRASIQARLERIKELYDWGDYSREKYLSEKAELQRRLAALAPEDEASQRLTRLAQYLKDFGEAWRDASQEQRSRMARRLFAEVWIDEKRVVAVRPQPEFEPFFNLQISDTACGTSGSDGIRTRDLSLDRAAC
jgi:site-specific DNA recombinase